MASELENQRAEPNADAGALPPSADQQDPAATGIAGLDAILGGGLPRNRAYLIEGDHGSGKTTLGTHFCVAGAEQGERVLYVTTCESEDEVRQIACSHGWSLEGVTIHYLDARTCLGDDPKQSVFHPTEVEFPKTMEVLHKVIDQVSPQRLVIDSLSEIRLLAANATWFRWQVLALKEDLAGRRCTTLLCDDRLGAAQQPVKSIVHGVIELEQLAVDYGPDRRRLRVAKLRAQPFASGYHDFKIRTGGLVVYPRLVAAEHRHDFLGETVSTGIPPLDAMFGGGVDRGTAVLLLGPSGNGKSIVATQFAVAAADRGERSAMYVFDERVQTLLQRAKGLNLDLQTQCDRGLVEIRQIDPAELTPGEFTDDVRRAILERGVRTVIIDSLAGYAYAMPDERSLTLHLHELLSFLGQQGVTVLMVMTQCGVSGGPRYAPFDLSYIADSVLLFHTFEHAGDMHRAISVFKRRSGPHDSTFHDLRFSSDGVGIGPPLRQYQGLLTGLPHFAEREPPNVRDHDHR